MKTNEALKSLAHLAFHAPGADALVVCDAVAFLAEGLAANLPIGPAAPEWKETQALATAAAATARAIRDADLRQFTFRDSLWSDPPATPVFGANVAPPSRPAHLPSAARAPLSSL